MAETSLLLFLGQGESQKKKKNKKIITIMELRGKCETEININCKYAIFLAARRKVTNK